MKQEILVFVVGLSMGLPIGMQRPKADDFTVTITDKAQLVGIAAARRAYNDALPPVLDETGAVVGPNLSALATDQEYLQMVVSGAAVSYARQFQTDLVILDQSISDLQAKRAAIAAEVGTK